MLKDVKYGYLFSMACSSHKLADSVRISSQGLAGSQVLARCHSGIGSSQFGGCNFPRLPRRAPELSAGIARRGAEGIPRVARGAWKPLLATPDESEERRRQAAIGPPFLWVLSFGGAKERTSAVGPRTHTQISPSRQRHLK